MTKLRRMIRNLPNLVEERPPGRDALPNGWYPKGQEKDGRRHLITTMRKLVSVHQYAQMAR